MKPRKLRLAKHTIRILAQTDLGYVVGGDTTTSKASNEGPTCVKGKCSSDF